MNNKLFMNISVETVKAMNALAVKAEKQKKKTKKKIKEERREKIMSKGQTLHKSQRQEMRKENAIWRKAFSDCIVREYKSNKVVVMDSVMEAKHLADLQKRAARREKLAAIRRKEILAKARAKKAARTLAKKKAWLKAKTIKGLSLSEWANMPKSEMAILGKGSLRYIAEQVSLAKALGVLA